MVAQAASDFQAAGRTPGARLDSAAHRGKLPAPQRAHPEDAAVTAQFLLALDQGTTGSTALVIDRHLRVVGKVNQEFPQIYPKPGWVEHDPEAIWQSILGAVRGVLAQTGIDPAAIAGIGITNQRETTVVWQRATGTPVANAIVWQCRRTAEVCDALKARPGVETLVRERTGLPIDAYFSGTKAAWLLDHTPGARAAADRGELAMGTIDSFLVWRLTGGAVHVTDPSNASRTMLYDIVARAWSPELCALLAVPASLLPDVRPSAHIYGHTRGVPGLPDGIPIAGLAGDQQAALCGQLCIEPGMAKCTYGTGAFLLMHTGDRPVPSRHGLLTTVAWQVGDRFEYALEGAVFIAGAAVQWLRDGLQILDSAPEIEALAQSVPDSGGVVFVPALVGLGAPHWNQAARGLICGLTRGTTRAHLARATLDGIALSCADLLDAMEKDLGRRLTQLRVDGGAAANDLLMQTQADLLQCQVVRPHVIETTALGAAILAGVGVGWFASLADAQAAWGRDRAFDPGPASATAALRAQWRAAVPKA
ncbi:MAG: glycerol kinase GlpK [Deltaproteobacteria bacterium]|nr:glycerol kinase GlpK [Deltaproteobacteria bacterium]